MAFETRTVQLTKTTKHESSADPIACQVHDDYAIAVCEAFKIEATADRLTKTRNQLKSRYGRHLVKTGDHADLTMQRGYVIAYLAKHAVKEHMTRAPEINVATGTLKKAKPAKKAAKRSKKAAK